MESWQWALLLKPLAVVLIAACYYVFVYKGSHFVGRFIRDGRLKEFLFRERGRYDAGRATDTRNETSRSPDDFRALPRRDRR